MGGTDVRAKDGPAPSGRRRRSDTSHPQTSGARAEASAAMAAARDGDLNAWHWIIREHQEPVFRSAYLATRDRALAEETTKAAFVHGYRSLSSFEEEAGFLPWLMRLADAIARARLREQAQQRDARAIEADPSPCLPATPYRLAAGAPTPTPEDAVALADAFDGLTDGERAVIAARYAFGLGRDAAAMRLDVEPAAIDGLLAAAIARLRVRTYGPMSGDTGPAPDPDAGGLPNEVSRFGLLSDDQFGSMAMATVMSGLAWTPDVAPVVCDRLARETVAYSVTSAVPDPTSRHQDARPPSSVVTTRRAASPRPSLSRSLGLVAGTSLLIVVFVLAAGGAGQRGSDLLADVRSSVEGLLGETSAPPASAASDAAGTAGESATSQSSTLSPAALTVEPPEASVVGVRRIGDGSLKGIVRLDWPPGAGHDAPVRARVERKGDDGTWSPLAWTDSHEPLLVEMKPGTTYGLRVRSVDASAAETVSPVSRLELSVRKAKSDRVAKSKGDWETRRGPSGQPRLVAVAPGARLSTRFAGTDVAFLSRLAPSLDSVGIRIDGGPWVRDPEPIARSGRMVLFSQDLDAGRHSLDLRALANGFAVDAFLILRSAGA